MSGLMNLFSGASADSNDSLKYSAPKEPKKKKKEKETSNSTPAADTPSTTTAATTQPITGATTTAPKTIGPSKMLANAAVHLYKLNPTTRGYDAVEGGGLLGCVLMGSGLNFQLLIYNSQKQPQAYIPLTPSFDYTVAGLYLSFQDASGNYYSVLFDVVEPMSNLLRNLAAVIVHLQSYNGDTGDMPNLKRALPPSSDQTAEDTTILSTGMTAGIYYSIWEMGELADYPTEVIAFPPQVQNRDPDDLLKVKLSDSEEFLPGLTTALTGCKRGDQFILAIPPQTLTSKPVQKSLFDPSRKKNPMAYLFIQIEISKIKSGDKEKEKKHVTRDSFTTEEREEVLHSAPSTAGMSSPELSSRIAKMSAAGGGGMAVALAGIMNPKGKTQSIPEAKRSVQFHESVEETAAIAVVPIPAKSPATGLAATTSTTVSQHASSENVVPFQQMKVSQNRSATTTTTTTTHAVSNTPMTNEIMTTSIQPSNTHHHNMMMTTSHDSTNSHHQQQVTQSMMIVQQSLMQLHTKLDQVGMQVQQVNTLQQQNQSQQQQISMSLQTLTASTMTGNSNGLRNDANNTNHNSHNNNNAMMMGMNPAAMGMGMPGMMNPMFNPMMFAAPNPYAAYSMYGNNATTHALPSSGGEGLPTSKNPAIKMKSDRILAELSHILQAYDQCFQENEELQKKVPTATTMLQVQQQQSTIQTLEAKVLSLEQEKKQLQRDKETWEQEKSKLEQQLQTSHQTLTQIEQLPTFQQKLQERLQPLQQQLTNLQSEYEALQQKMATTSPAVVVTPSTPPREDTAHTDALKQEIESLKQLLQTKDQEIINLQQNKSTASPAAVIAEKEEGGGNGKKYTEEEMKSVISEIYKRSMNSFMTEEELNSLEDETLRNHTLQVVKTTLKRLKEVVREVMVDRLSP